MQRILFILALLFVATGPIESSGSPPTARQNFVSGIPRWPHTSLLAVGGILYGTASNGGARGLGAVFAVNPITGAEITLHSLYAGDNPEGALVAGNGNLYGTTSQSLDYSGGTVFGINQTTGQDAFFHHFAAVAQGTNPVAGMIFLHGKLYGTTVYGGSACGCGVVFELDPLTGHERVLHSFGGGSDGEVPQARLIEVKGTLYGTTLAGGNQSCSSGCGTVFAIDPSSGVERIVYSFTGSDGAQPYGRMVAVDGKLFGTTAYGGARAEGTLFEVDPVTGAERVLHSFPSYYGDGENPNPDVIVADGKLFGTTRIGHGSYCGTVFKINLSTNLETTIHRFPCSGGVDGNYPHAGPIWLNGELYGTTNSGGTNDRGTVYKISPSGAEIVVHSF